MSASKDGNVIREKILEAFKVARPLNNQVIALGRENKKEDATARAGEQGKGFAVVAVEVRNLAQRAANAAGEVKQLINESVDRITDGSQQVAQAGKTMEDIVDAIQEVSSIVSDIATASIEQNAGIEQVHEAVVQMDNVTQQNAALVEEAAAESLSDQTRHLAQKMAHFKT